MKSNYRAYSSDRVLENDKKIIAFLIIKININININIIREIKLNINIIR